MQESSKMNLMTISTLSIQAYLSDNKDQPIYF